MKLRNMKRNSILFALSGMLLFLVGCKDKKPAPMVVKPLADSMIVIENVPDTTVYGVCEGDTLYYQMNVEEDAHVRGGLMVGDRLAVVGSSRGDEGLVAQGVINLTTLLGKWSSIDRNFEIQDGGALLSDSKEPQVGEWKISNGQLVLRADTFSIYELGTDSLYLENKKGIYAYKRIR